MTKQSKRTGAGGGLLTLEQIVAKTDKLMARASRWDRRGTFKGALRAEAADAELGKMDAVIARAGFTIDDVMGALLQKG